MCCREHPQGRIRVACGTDTAMWIIVCIIIIIIIIIRPIIIIYLFHQFITMPFILILDFPVATCIILPRVPYHRVPLFLDG